MNTPNVSDRFEDVPGDVCIGVDETTRDGRPYLRGVIYRRLDGDQWLFDGVEGVLVPLDRGEAVARIRLFKELETRFGVMLADSGTVPS